jgi:hypothetical protein
MKKKIIFSKRVLDSFRLPAEKREEFLKGKPNPRLDKFRELLKGAIQLVGTEGLTKLDKVFTHGHKPD